MINIPGGIPVGIPINTLYFSINTLDGKTRNIPTGIA